MALSPGEVVIADFRGEQGVKRRPTIVVSTALYQTTRPDIILAELTTKVSLATAPTDYLLRDWASAGLHFPSAFRAYLDTLVPRNIIWLGRLSDVDWKEVQARLRLALAVT